MESTAPVRYAAAMRSPRKAILWMLIILVVAVSGLAWFGKGHRLFVARASLSDAAGDSPELLSKQAEQERRAAVSTLGPMKHRDGVNAADIYGQAIALYDQLTYEEREIFDNASEHKGNPPDTKTAAALYSKVQPIMDLIRHGRSADYVEWGDAPSIGDYSAYTKRINGVGNLANLAAWEADYRFSMDPGGAVEDLAAMEKMNFDNDDSVIGFVGWQTDHFRALNIMAGHVSDLAGEEDPAIMELVDSTAAERGFRNAMGGQAATYEVILNELKNSPDTPPHIAQWFSEADKASRADQIAGIQWLIMTERETGTTFTKTDDEYRQWYESRKAEAAANPIARANFRPEFFTRRLARQMVVTDAMMRAGMAFEQNDEARFQSITDPISGRPFTFTHTGSGFSLGSDLKVSDDPKAPPVTLNFSTGPAQ